MRVGGLVSGGVWTDVVGLDLLCVVVFDLLCCVVVSCAVPKRA